MLRARAQADSPRQDISVQQPKSQTAAISRLCQTNRISSAACGSPAGAAPRRMRSDVWWATRFRESPRSQAVPEAVWVLFICSDTRRGGPAGRQPCRMEWWGPGNRLAGLCRGIFEHKQASAQEISSADEVMGLLKHVCRAKAEVLLCGFSH